MYTFRNSTESLLAQGWLFFIGTWSDNYISLFETPIHWIENRLNPNSDNAISNVEWSTNSTEETLKGNSHSQYPLGTESFKGTEFDEPKSIGWIFNFLTAKN